MIEEKTLTIRQGFFIQIFNQENDVIEPFG